MTRWMFSRLVSAARRSFVPGGGKAFPLGATVRVFAPHPLLRGHPATPRQDL
ncbi:MAG: hypothetical protein WCH04_18065 [Gammaproteobacteria bacterium]